MAFLFLRPAQTPGPALRDFEAYYAAGATWRVDGDAYGRDVWRVERRVPGVVATRDELLPFVGPPFTLALWGIFGSLPYGAAVAAWGVVLAGAAALLGWCTARLAGLVRPVDVAALVLFGAAFGPLTSALALGQVALVAVAGVVATTVALSTTNLRVAVASAAACLAALQPNMAVALFARLGDRRSAFALGGAAVFVLALSVATLGGFAGFERYLAVLAAHARAERTIVIQVTVAAVAFGFGTGDRIAQTIGSAVAAGVVVATGWLLRSRAYDPPARVAVACAGLPLVLPFSHEHDLVVALFPAVCCVRRARGTWWMAAGCATVAVAVDWLGLAQRPTGLAQSVALAFAVALCVVALSPERGVGPAMLPLAAGAAVAAVGTFAAHHPVGVWPYGLGASFHAPMQLDATGVWALEQARSGLDAPNAASAVLRAISLAGCAALWIASLAVLRRAKGSPAPGVIAS